MINQEPIYRLEDLDDDGSQYLTRTEIISMDSVDINQADNGEITFTPKVQEQPAEGPGAKYRLVPEGTLFRLIALHNKIPGVFTGERGGLVSGPDILSHEGMCWIHDGGTVTGEVRIHENATTWGETYISADENSYVRLGGSASISACRITVDGRSQLEVDGSVALGSCTVNMPDGAAMHLMGSSSYRTTTFNLARDARIRSAGGNVTDGYIRNHFEMLSVFHNEFGWLSAFRDTSGSWHFRIGCQMASNADGLRDLAARFHIHPVERDMLEHFLAMVDAAGRGWVDYTPPVEEPKSDTTAAAASDADGDGSGEVPVTQPSFADLADRARDAVRILHAPPPVRPAQMTHDQYGTDFRDSF